MSVSSFRIGSRFISRMIVIEIKGHLPNSSCLIEISKKTWCKTRSL